MKSSYSTSPDKSDVISFVAFSVKREPSPDDTGSYVASLNPFSTCIPFSKYTVEPAGI